MQKTIVNAETGEVVTVDLTPEEVAEQEALAEAIQDEFDAFVPLSVPMWAVRTVLENNGLIEQAQALVTASDNVALKNIWEYGNFADRNSAAINSLALALGLTSEQVDQMFRDANSLSV